jgi:RNA polymerase sigma factor (sigma-70 family)
MTHRPFHELLRDLPPVLRRAVHYSVVKCRPQVAPRPYANDWEEELYHEAACAAWIAYRTYDPHRGCSLFLWGVRVTGQHLKRFCDTVWTSEKHECDMPHDEETDEEVDFEDPAALEPFLVCTQVCIVQAATERLCEQDRLIASLYLLDGITEAEIAARLGVSRQAVNKRLQRIIRNIRTLLDAGGTSQCSERQSS